MTVQDTQAPSGTDDTTTAATATVDTTLPPAAIDPDDLELEQAEAAAKAEEEASKAPSSTEPAAGTAATPPAAATKETPDHVPTIPKPRFDEVYAKLRDTELENARLKGRLEASTPPATTTAPAAPQPGPQDRIAAIDNDIEALAKKFDDGEITMSEFKRQERTLEASKQAIREEQLLARVPKPAAAESTDDSLYLHQQTQQVATQHPWVDVFEKVGTDADWAFVKARSLDDMKERGFDSSNKAAADLELRQTMARIMDEFGPTLVASRAQKAGIALPNGQKPAAPAATPPAQKQPLSPMAQARAEKLDLAGKAPPNLDAMSGTAGDGTPSAAAIEAMSEEDIAALPRAVQDKILGLTAA